MKKLLQDEPKEEENLNIIDENNDSEIIEEKLEKRGRGRPKKVVNEEEVKEETTVKRGRGRPRKNLETENNLEVTNELDEEPILPGFEELDEEPILPGFEEVDESEPILPGFEDDDEDEILTNFNQQEELILPGFEEVDEENIAFSQSQETKFSNNLIDSYNKQENEYISSNLLITGENKIISFVGTSKNGTSFIVNNIAELLSSTGINIAILDTTKNKNSYYIYTKNDEELRKIAFLTSKKLKDGLAEGIKVNKNLTVYTCLPNSEGFAENIDTILSTLINKHTVVLIDCDFDTPIEYFKHSQEIYLVQTMDVLTIQPLTAFLRELKVKNVLDESKLRIILNKFVKLKGISEKAIIGGMAYYNDPAMSFMTELFDRNTIRYLLVPLEYENYTTYIESLINCDITLKGYSKNFMQCLKQIGNSIYPLANEKNSKYVPNQYQNNFSSNMNNTLNKMKKKF